MRTERPLSAALLLAAVLALVTLTDLTAASFTATTVSPDNVLATATLAISNDKPGAADLVNVTDLVPGDTVARQVTISNIGNASFAYTVTASPFSNTSLWSDTTNGLQVTVKRDAATVYSGALKDLAVPASASVAPSATDTLTFEFSLPSTAGNTFQGLTQQFTVTYTATQLAGTAK